MRAVKVLGYAAAAVLIFLGIIFALASAYAISRLAVALVLFLAAFGIIYYIQRSTPKEIVQRYEVELPGKVETRTVKCPNCGASLDLTKIQVTQGMPSIKCPYCGHTSEVTEEPKW